jgi:excisionase family DNA binding protein
MPKVIGDMTLYTVLELSKLLDVTEVTLRRYINEGKLKAKKIGGAYHISEEALKEFVEKGEPKNKGDNA